MNGHWGKFMTALDDIEGQKATSTWPWHGMVCDMLRQAEKFYLPGDVSIVEGKQIDNELQERLRLPYDLVAVLGECNWESQAGAHPVISIAFEVQGEANHRNRWVYPSDLSGWGVASVSYHPIARKWLPMPALVSYEHQLTGGYKLSLFSESWLEKHRKTSPEDIDVFTREFLPDIDSVQNLCLMLSLSNVRQERAEPPAKLNKARERRGKQPFHSYNVLVVDGLRWDSVHRGGHSDGYRSHMRRGHIRRLDENRRVWVSSCFVKGRQTGFVDKVYRMDGEAVH